MAASVAAGCLVIAGCGSSSKSTTATTAGSSGGSTATTSAGTKANSSLAPFEIGLLNVDQGINSYPGVNDGALTAAKYISSQLGGIDGHPVKVVTCDAGVDAQSELACGQQFANDSAIKAVISGYVFAGGGAYTALASAHKSVIGGEPLVAADFSAKNVYFYRGGTPSVIPGISVFALTKLKAKSGALIISTDSAGEAAIPLAEAPWKSAKLPLKEVGVPDSEPDMTGPIASAKASTADVVMPLLSAPGCIQAAKALSSLSITKPVVTTSLCSDASVLAAVKSQMNGWYFLSDSDSNDPTTGVSADVQTMRTAWKSYGVGNVAQTSTILGFANTMIAYQLAKKLGYAAATSSAMGTAMAAFKGPVYAGAPKVSCPGTTLHSVCSTEYTAEQLKNGTFQLYDNGAFFSLNG